MKIRHEFVLKALEPHANISELCREHGISRKTAYKWLERFKSRGVQGLEDLSKRPHNSPLRGCGRRERWSCRCSNSEPDIRVGVQKSFTGYSCVMSKKHRACARSRASWTAPERRASAVEC